LPLATVALLGWSCGGPVPRALPLPKEAPSAIAPVAPDPEPWRRERPAPGAPGALEFPTAERAELSNGLTLLLVKRPVPIVSMQLVFRHGASACPPGKSGLAALTARMLTEGTKRHPGPKLAAAVEQLGTTLDADTERDTTTLSMSVLAADTERALELLAEVVQEPSLAGSDFERVQKEWLDGLRSERQSPERLASLVALVSLLGKPHGSPVSGHIGDVSKLTSKDIVSFHRRAYTADHAALVVVGDLELAVVRKHAERVFGKLPKGGVELDQPFSPAVTASSRHVLLVDRPGAVQSVLALVQPFPKRSEPGFETRELLGTLLGGLFTSRLNTNLREEHGYTYGARAQNVATRHWGALFVASSVRSDVTAEALREALKELEQVREPSLGEPIAEAELKRARADLVQSLGARLEHGTRIGSAISDLWSERLPSDYYRQYPQLLARETTESVTRAAGLITPERLLTVVVGDRQQIEAPLRQAGFDVALAPPELLD
jgi:zinc protease